MSGYSDAGTLRYLDDDVINDVQQYVKTKGLKTTDGKAESVLFVGDLYKDDIEGFEFNLGERRQMLCVAKHAESLFQPNELPTLAKKRKIDYSEVTFLTSLNGWLFKKRTAAATTLQVKDEKMESVQSDPKLESALFDSMVNTLQKTLTPEHWDLVKDSVLETSGMTSVETERSGLIKCILCQQNNNEKCISVSVKFVFSEKETKRYWVMSNFKEHLTQVHGMGPTDESRFSNKKKGRSAVKNTKFKKQRSTKSENSLLTQDEMHEEKGHIESYTEEEVEVVVVSSDYVYQQISKQIGEMSTCVHELKLIQQKVKFFIDTKECEMQVVRMKSDGSCLFRAIVHQLYPQLKINSKSFENNVGKLRAEAVSYIEENYDDFLIQLKNAIYDRQIDPSGDVSYIEDKCHEFLKNDLPKSSCWGGSESLIALSILYSVNIFVFSECGPVLCATDFNSDYKKSICIAYRASIAPRASGKLKMNPNLKRNHYDSITDVDDQDIYDLSEEIKSRLIDGQVIALEISSTN